MRLKLTVLALATVLPLGNVHATSQVDSTQRNQIAAIQQRLAQLEKELQQAKANQEKEKLRQEKKELKAVTDHHFKFYGLNRHYFTRRLLASLKY